MSVFPLKDLWALLVFPILILINLIDIHWTIRTAVKQFVKPKFENEGLIYLDYKWTGLFNFGDFRKNYPAGTFSMSRTGRYTNTMYAFIYYKSLDTEKKVTIRIDKRFFAIEKVVYSSKLLA